jgi:hypothetical protein
VIGGDEGVEVGIGVPVSGATDEDVDASCRLAALSVARFASIACLWAESVGTAELEASRSFPDAVSNRLGREAVFVVIDVIPSDSGGSMSNFFLF